MLSEIRKFLSNEIPDNLNSFQNFSGVIGINPSQYSKSPKMWNLAFMNLELPNIYIPFDVDLNKFGQLIEVLKQTENFIGGNITNPYKLKIIEYLDGIDEFAYQVGSVNTIYRDPSGNLIGANTDGLGFIDSLLQPGQINEQPGFESIENMNVLLIGGGGAARVLANKVAANISNGQLYIANRTHLKSQILAEINNNIFANTSAIQLENIDQVMGEVKIVINSTNVGQKGIHTPENGSLLSLESFSPLSPVTSYSAGDLNLNNQLSAALIESAKPGTFFYDIIYSPKETVFLKQAKEAGFQTMNGEGMLVYQAVHAFTEYIFKKSLYSEITIDMDNIRSDIAGIMFLALN